MKLYLKITTPSGNTRSIERSGSVLRVGRDPVCELNLQGEEGHAVSWNHARIEIAAGGATVTDAGSSNGTLLNDQRIEGPMPLRVGDRVQLGHTGATLTVTGLNLSVPVPQPPSSRPPLPPAVYVVGTVATAVVLVVALLLMNKGSGKTSEDQQAQANPNQGPINPETKASPTSTRKGPEDKRDSPDGPSPAGKTGPKQPQGKPPDQHAEPASSEPDEVRDIGRYVALTQWGPGILLQRQGTAYPWTPLRRESKVTTAATLVSLPGYRSTLTMDSGVQLTLWGDIPEFSPFPPVLESVAMLNLPGAGIDLDVTLERGRIHLLNNKPSGASQVRLRFLRQDWQLTLPEPGSEACVELWPLLGQGPVSASDSVAPIVIGLFVKGKAQLQAAGQTLDLVDRSRVTWVNVAGAPPKREEQTELPAWWTKPPDRTQPRTADAMISLLDWSNYLNGSNEIVDTILTRIRESKDSTLRCLGLLFLAALDEPSFLVDFLEDRQHAEVRGTARHALQVWLSRRPDSQAELARLLKRGYAREKGALIGRLLQRIPDAELAKPEIYQSLIGYLDHENLIVRDLAFWHLAQLVPEGAAQIAYDPVAEADKRRKSVADWQKLIPPSTVPRTSGK